MTIFSILREFLAKFTQKFKLSTLLIPLREVSCDDFVGCAEKIAQG